MPEKMEVGMQADTERNRRILEGMLDGDTFAPPEVEYRHRSNDFVAEIPQTGERIEGRDELRRLQEAFGDPPRVRLQRISGEGDFWAVETIQSYGGDGDYHVCVLVEFTDGKISRETRYYGRPLETDRD